MTRYRQCTCPDGQNWTGQVETTLPDGWQSMSGHQRDLLSTTKCCSCGKVLKCVGEYWDGKKWRT